MVRLLLWSWAQGVGVAIAASKRARRCATSAARCVMNRRLSSGDTLVSHRGGRTCGLPASKDRLGTKLRHSALTTNTNPYGTKAKFPCCGQDCTRVTCARIKACRELEAWAWWAERGRLWGSLYYLCRRATELWLVLKLIELIHPIAVGTRTKYLVNLLLKPYSCAGGAFSMKIL